MRNLTLCSVLLAVTACPAADPMTTVTASDASTGGGSTGDGSTGGSTMDSPTSTTGSTTDALTTGETAGGSTGGVACDSLDIPPIDESGCTPLDSDYEPRVNNSADDSWPACVSDMGPYTLVDKTPSTIARIVAYEMIGDLLWRKKDPTPADFTAARDQYVIAEGLESRVVRREDFHVPAIPMNEWDMQVDPDKQCTVPALAMKYPDRCVGPAKMAPLLDGAFTAGQAGTGDPNVLAEQIHAGLWWFLYLSVYKEANTCASVAAKDCDSAWAYYTGGEAIDAGIGIAAEVRAISVSTHERLHDGMMAVRCWRDIAQDMGMYPLLDAVPQDQKDLFAQGWEQLDQGLHRGYAVVLRDYMQKYVDAACSSSDTAALWAFIKISGEALQREADERDPTNAKILADLWAADAPGPDAVAAGIGALDTVFPCP